jgi:hypothetical protein
LIKKVSWIIVVIFYFSLSLKGQTTRSMEGHQESLKSSPVRVLVIPFESKMYMSKIDREIAEKTGLNSTQIRTNVRRGITDMVFLELKNRKVDAVSLMHSEDPEVGKNLSYIYHSIAYQYLPIPQDTDTNDITPKQKAKDFVRRFTKDDNKQEQPGTRIEEGQLKTTYQQGERFMNTNITNPLLFETLFDKYETNYFVFINQLDMDYVSSNDLSVSAVNQDKRRAKVHYTLFDLTGKEIYGGVELVYFSSQKNDLNSIVRKVFATAAEGIVSRFDFHEMERQYQLKKAEEEQKATEQENKILKYRHE